METHEDKSIHLVRESGERLELLTSEEYHTNGIRIAAVVAADDEVSYFKHDVSPVMCGKCSCKARNDCFHDGRWD